MKRCAGCFSGMTKHEQTRGVCRFCKPYMQLVLSRAEWQWLDIKGIREATLRAVVAKQSSAPLWLSAELIPQTVFRMVKRPDLPKNVWDVVYRNGAEGPLITIHRVTTKILRLHHDAATPMATVDVVAALAGPWQRISSPDTKTVSLYMRRDTVLHGWSNTTSMPLRTLRDTLKRLGIGLNPEVNILTGEDVVCSTHDVSAA